jgi:hypothetical protein
MLPLLFAFAAHAATPITDGRWTCGDKAVQIAGDRIRYGKESYVVGAKEKVGETSAVSSSTFLGGDSSKCLANTIRANRGPGGELVLARLLREKPSRSGGQLCGLTSNIAKLSRPFVYEILVLTQNGPTLTMKTVFVGDGIDQPRLSDDDLKNPALETQDAVKEYLKVGQRNGYVSTVQCEPVPEDHDELGNDVYSRTGDKGLVSPKNSAD